MSLSTSASRPAVTSSPEATIASYSALSASAPASLVQATSSLVLPAMAETTTATSWPASTSRLTWRATLRMRSTLATDVPPNFITRRDKRTSDAVRESARSREGPRRRIKAGFRRVNAATRARPRAPLEEVPMNASRSERHCRRGRPLRRAGRQVVGRGRADGAAASADAGPGGLGARRRGPPFRPRGEAGPPLAGLKVLDVGCGAGLFAEPLARLGGDVLGIDPAPASIGVARRHAEETGARLAYRVGDGRGACGRARRGSTS